jgi:KUP system potassium uptake protein
LLALAAAFLLTVDLLFLAANATKIAHGAWLPLLIALVTFTILTTWQRGREVVTALREKDEGSLRSFIDGLHENEPPVERVTGTAVFLNRSQVTAPLAMRASVDHLHALHEHVVILCMETLPVPHVPPAARLEIDDLGYRDDGITLVNARLGYMDAAKVPLLLREVEKADIECPLEVDRASYFLSTIDLAMGDNPVLPRWRKRLFLATAQITSDAADYFHLPREQTVVLGSRIEL